MSNSAMKLDPCADWISRLHSNVFLYISEQVKLQAFLLRPAAAV